MNIVKVTSAGMQRSEHEELRRYVETGAFAQLKRGGLPDLHIEAIIYCGGKPFVDGETGELVPYKVLNFKQQPR